MQQVEAQAACFHYPGQHHGREELCPVQDSFFASKSPQVDLETGQWPYSWLVLEAVSGTCKLDFCWL